MGCKPKISVKAQGRGRRGGPLRAKNVTSLHGMDLSSGGCGYLVTFIDDFMTPMQPEAFTHASVFFSLPRCNQVLQIVVIDMIFAKVTQRDYYKTLCHI